LIQNLLSLCHTARTVPTGLPAEIVDYVERSRNPDIYTREFVELVQKLNQQLKGRSQAFADFRDILAREIMSALPDCKQDIDMVLESTGANTRHTL
jgi:mediator of RNA polymerase II transcription subunit 10